MSKQKLSHQIWAGQTDRKEKKKQEKVHNQRLTPSHTIKVEDIIYEDVLVQTSEGSVHATSVSVNSYELCPY